VSQNHCPGCYANIDVSWNSCPSCQETLYFYGKTGATGKENNEALEAAKLEQLTLLPKFRAEWETRYEDHMQQVNSMDKATAKAKRNKKASGGGLLAILAGGIIGAMLGFSFGA